ncbi:MAG: hypothetical protein A2133_07220 [Actinobacteria bacterium RBG_16_64_13]|nr:MAG: hypothetical protein A2133_07220 [Actinobacteria bacterium RBG_16_64_13]
MGPIRQVGERPADARRRAKQDYECVHPQKVRRLLELPMVSNMPEWRLLDVGCGYHYPQVALFEGKVGLICGVDIEQVFFRDGWLRTVVQRSREHGLLRGAKRGTQTYLYYVEYYRHLRRLAGIEEGRHSHYALSSYDGGRFPYPDGSFDVVTSNAVLEHVLNLEGFVSECHRVLAPGGCVDMWWHNFYCPSGSHLPRQVRERSPWGHVTGDVVVKMKDLNRKKPKEIEEAFGRQFRIVRLFRSDAMHRQFGDPGFTSEAAERLDHDWRDRLDDLPDDLLTTTGYVIQAQKSPPVTGALHDD